MREKGGAWVREQWVQGGDNGTTGAMMDVKTFARVIHSERSQGAAYLNSGGKLMLCF